MLRILLFFLTSVACSSSASADIAYWQPEQVHISFGETTEHIVVVWSTPNETEQSLVKYGEVGLKTIAVGSQKKFTDGGKLKRKQWIHRVALTNLKPNTTYTYHCGSRQGWSDLFFFKTPQKGEQFEVRAVFYGDLGNINAKSLVPLQEEIQANPLYDMILHVGDFAYDMHSDDAKVGDQFMRQIEPIAAYVPYMTCPGNHEEYYNFSNYKNRFPMPGSEDGRMFYSFDLGPVHFISINTEVYYFYSHYGQDQIATQYNWLVNDLVAAASDKVRKIRPWIVLFGHRPMYCSDDDGDDCTKQSARTRVGVDLDNSGTLKYGLESLLYHYGVDVVIWAHEHTYERLWPLYDFKVMNGTQGAYVNPGAPIHIISGSAGCQEKVDKFKAKPPWSAFRSSDYGYARLNAYNDTHLHIEQVSVDKENSVIDGIWVEKHYHGSYADLNIIKSLEFHCS